MRYSLSSSLMSTNGAHSATVIASFPPSSFAAGRPHRLDSRFSISWSSFHGFNWTRKTVPIVIALVWLALLSLEENQVID